MIPLRMPGIARLSPFARRPQALLLSTVLPHLVLPFFVLLAGCHHRQPVQQPPQYAPPLPPPQSQLQYPQPQSSPPSSRIPITPVPPGGVTDADLDFINTHRPILSETGLATWYTAFRGRKAANGQLFDDTSLTAAHRTLPMGSLVLVTNLKTRQSSAMRINDRGPFIDGRMLDLTIASAKATGVYRAGLVQVRMDVYQAPKPIETGGRWCVQIGAFKYEETAIQLKEQLIRLYPGSNVIEFPGDNSFWVRIRPEGDNREQAESIVRRLRPVEGQAFLTRLD